MVNLFRNGKTGKELTRRADRRHRGRRGNQASWAEAYRRDPVVSRGSTSWGLVRGEGAKGARHGRRPLRLLVLKWVARRDGKTARLRGLRLALQVLQERRARVSRAPTTWCGRV